MPAETAHLRNDRDRHEYSLDVCELSSRAPVSARTCRLGATHVITERGESALTSGGRTASPARHGAVAVRANVRGKATFVIADAA